VGYGGAAASLGAFALSTCLFATLFGHPASAVGRLAPGAWPRFAAAAR
jgi:hypothetical protein